MRIISGIFFIVIHLFFVIGQMESKEPSFRSKEGVHQALMGQTVDLPCEIDNLGEFTVLWSKEGLDGAWVKGDFEGGVPIFAERTKMINDDRFEYATKDEDPSNWTLRINAIEGFDDGVYRCVISTVPDQMVQKQILSVKVPPSVNIVPEKSPHSFEAGSHIQLTCHSSGNPVPTVIWTRLEGPLPDGSASHIGSELHMENAASKHDGTYKCTANNSVGEPAEAEIKIQVISKSGPKDAPTVTGSPKLVYVKTDGAFNVTCSYTGSPSPTVQWFHNNFEIKLPSAKYSDRYKMSFQERDGFSVTTLSNDKVKLDDYGDYKCKIGNDQGVAEHTSHVTGYPGVAQLNTKHSSDGVLLSWTIDSPEPIDEYRIDYKRVADKDYQNLTIKSQDVLDYSNEGISYKGQYALRGLESHTDYEVSVIARNQNGWGSQPRELYHFKTDSTGSKTENMNVKDANPPKVKDSVDEKKDASSMTSSVVLSLASILLVLGYIGNW